MALKGCDLCSDWPVHLHGRCHPMAPLRVELTEDGTLSLFCYVPDCNRLITRFKVDSARQLSRDHMTTFASRAALR